MNIAVFGSSLLSSYWNGAATYYRGIIRALSARGHHTTFYEPIAYQRQDNRDFDFVPWADVVVYEPEERQVEALLDRATSADLLLKTSGIGVLDAFIESRLPALKRGQNKVGFWDVDAPATLDRLAADPIEPFRSIVPQLDFVFTYGGGKRVVDGYKSFGAKHCFPIYNGLDPSTHFPVKPKVEYSSYLSFLGHRLPDRETRVDEFFFSPAAALLDQRFLLAGNAWQGKSMPANVRYLGHLPTAQHNDFFCSALAVLNVCRQSMADYGYSPATRVFEAAGSAACLITDAWIGVEAFFEPEREILVAGDGNEVVRQLSLLTPAGARRIGERARKKALTKHTYESRGAEFEAASEQIRKE